MDTQPQHGYPVNPPYQAQRGYEGPRYQAPMHDYHQHITPPKPKRKKWPWVVGGLALLLVLCGIGAVSLLGLGAKAVSDEMTATKADVSLVPGSCKADEVFGWKAQVKITNSSKSTKRSYWVQVNLERSGTRLGEGHAVVNDLGPGQTTTEDVTGSGKMQKGASCVIGDVN